MAKSYNFSMEDCNFYVNEEKRTIACVLNDTAYMFEEFADEQLAFRLEDLYLWPMQVKVIHKLRMPKRFVGIAKCAEEDEWDEELGRKIAYARLREKVYTSFFKKAEFYVKTLDDFLDKDAAEINAFGVRLHDELERRNSYIADALSSKEN